MKARKNPTNEQILRRLRRPLESNHDPRIKNDAYYALRFQGYPHAYAKRAFRDEPPVLHQRIIWNDLGEYSIEQDELFFPAGSKWTEVEIAIRPDLTEETIPTLKPRASEYTVWDNQITGFGVRVRASGHASYILLYRHRYEKKLRKFTIGKVGEFTLKQARSIAKVHRQAARTGCDPAKLMREWPNEENTPI